MRSQVAETSRKALQSQVADLPIEQRIELMFEIAEQDLQAVLASTGLSREEALRQRKLSIALGRRQPSRCHLPD